MDFALQLDQLLGLKDVNYHYQLEKPELFHAAIENDRGRVREGGEWDEQKAYATKLGDKGPLVYYTDPSATGRRVKDTFAVAYPEFEDKIWWKPDFGEYDPDHYEALEASGLAGITLRAVGDRVGLSKGALYGILEPEKSGLGCPLCGDEVGYPNRTAKERGSPSAPCPIRMKLIYYAGC